MGASESCWRAQTNWGASIYVRRKIGVCDEAAAALIGLALMGVALVRCEAPNAGDAIQICVPEIVSRKFADLALLDGHYLRRSDAEIFGDNATSAKVRNA